MDREGTLPPTQFIQQPFGNVRRSSIHLEQAENELLTHRHQLWFDLGRTVSSDERSLGNEYYHKISEAPFKKRFPNFLNVSINRDKTLKENMNISKDFYAGNQTAYFIDDEVNKKDVISEYSRPSLHQLMGQYRQNPAPVPEVASNTGYHLPRPPQNYSVCDGATTNLVPGHRRSRASELHRKLAGKPENRRLATDDGIARVDQSNVNLDEHRSKIIQLENDFSETFSKSSSDVGLSSALGLVVKSTSGDAPKQSIDSFQNSAYEKRKEYGKNLERNWLTDKIQKQRAHSQWGIGIDMSSDMFYSPDFTESEGGDDVESVHGGQRTGKPNNVETELDIFSSTDVLMGNEGELDQSTASDYEIVIKDNVLVEKKTKHKMRKKRRRKKDTYRKYIRHSETEPTTDPDMSHLTDSQLRAMRLKVKRRNVPARLKGKRKFLQIANAIFVFVLFCKLLRKVRKSRRRKRRAQKKLVNATLETENLYEDFERKPTPFSLKDHFMTTIGGSLIKDVMKLDIRDDNDCKCSDEQMSTVEPWQTIPIEELLANVSEDAKLHPLANRRYSDPGMARPQLFPIEISEMPKVRRHDCRKVKTKTKPRQKRPRSYDSRKRTCLRDHRLVDGRMTTECPLHCLDTANTDGKKKIIWFDKSEVLGKRRPSLDSEEIKAGKHIDLHELLAGIDMPAKEIRIEIAMRKIRRRKLRQSIRPKIIAKASSFATRPRFDIEEAMMPQNPTVIAQNPLPESLEPDKEELTRKPQKLDDESLKSTCTAINPPIVSYGGLAWDPVNTPPRPRYSEDEIAQELERVSKLFLELKDCRYIRWTPFHQAVIDRIENSTNTRIVY